MDRININDLIICEIILYSITYKLREYMNNNTIYMYIESPNLPTYGWIQSCLCCDMATGNTYKFKIGYIYAYNIEAYMCKRCIISTKNQRMVMKDAPNFIKHLSNRNH